MQNVSIADIKPNPFQARQSIDPQRIRELADEIKETGFWPTGLLARQVNGHYELVFGHRRLQALKLLGRKTIGLEIVKLDDAAMATQTMIENLQREGLTDIEKANGLKRLFDLGRYSVKDLGRLLGYPESTIKEFLRLAEFNADTQHEIETSGLSRTAVRTADNIAGPEFVRVAARHKLDRNKLDVISKDVSKVKPETRQKLVSQLRTGKLTTPEQVKRAARRLSGQAIPKSKVPPDLHEVLIDWVASIRAWRKQLRAIEPYREYIDSDPVVAEMFRKEVTGLIEDLQRLL
jgi:ParB family transcriptional regulator, chromosome partitioning protein